MTTRRLLTIPISHFCEKARWALERAGLEHREERHVQGINRIVSKRAGGHGTLPVLICEAGVLAESEAILRYADAHLPEERRLFPDGAAGVTKLCRELDAGLGPDGRRLMYAHMLPRKEFMLEFNDVGVPRWEDRMLRSLWPVVAHWGRRELGVRDDTLERDRPRVLAAFDGIAERLGDGRPYLFGERFTGADLTFAALAAAVVVPPEYGTPLPQPDVLPEPVARDVAAFRAHPAGAIALRMFRDHRRAAGASSPIVGAMPDVLRPLFDQVVIKELEPDRMRKSGLLVPQGSNDLPPNEGIVLAAGDGPPDLPDFKMPVKPGDHVVFPRSAGVWVEVEDERLLVCRVREILGVIEEAEK